MKYKYNNQWKDLTVKAGDTLPIGTIVTYDGDTVPSGYEEVNSYSTTEVKTGDTWIDGKPIYRKVYTGTKGTDISLDIPNNLNQMIDMRGLILSRWGQWWTIPNYYNDDITQYWTSIHHNVANGKINVSAGTSFDSNSSYIVIVEYTKTTD